MRQDVMETRSAIKEVLDSDKLLAGVCLSDKGSEGAPPPDCMRAAALLLESYERQISTVEGALKVRHRICQPHFLPRHARLFKSRNALCTRCRFPDADHDERGPCMLAIYAIFRTRIPTGGGFPL